ncbi:MAG: OB-fold nucleic acid binding domain-containing protein, partial [Bacteroidales bacterium]|nr:OB-fold nucleic acid binding domain-containing protein [Bacteroidales bacterium]
TESVQKIAKNGSSYGIFTLEDFSGNINLMLFSEEYLKKKHLLEVGNNIFVIAKIEEYRNRPGSLSIQVTDIFLLVEAMSKLSKNIALTVHAGHVNDELVNKLSLLARNNAGDCELQLFLKDTEAGISLQMKSSSVKVEPRSFILGLNTFKNLEYQIN